MPDNDELKPRDEYHHLPDFLKYYSNNVRFETTVWDLAITFGELSGHVPNGGSLVEQKVEIKLSWSQAKVMAIFLAINVATHEETQGAERIPSFAFADALRHLGDQDMTLEQMFPEIIKVFNDQVKPALDKP